MPRNGPPSVGQGWLGCKYVIWQCTAVILLVFCMTFLGAGVKLMFTDLTPSENCTANATTHSTDIDEECETEAMIKK